MSRWLVIGIVGAMLSVQRWTGFIVDRRPTTLPYLMGVHFALDASLPLLTFLVSNGMSLSR